LAAIVSCGLSYVTAFGPNFRNSSLQDAPAVVNHLVIIGCPEIADIIQRALDSHGIAEISMPAIEAAINQRMHSGIEP
jgi:hypothetical protein